MVSRSCNVHLQLDKKYWDTFGTWLAIHLNWMLAGLEMVSRSCNVHLQLETKYWDTFGTWLAIYLNWMLAGWRICNCQKAWCEVLMYGILWHDLERKVEINPGNVSDISILYSSKTFQRYAEKVIQHAWYSWYNCCHNTQFRKFIVPMYTKRIEEIKNTSGNTSCWSCYVWLFCNAK